MKEVMRFDVNENVKVSGWPTIYAALALTGKTKPGSVVNSGGNFYRDPLDGFHLSGSPAFRALMGNDLSGSPAVAAGGSDREKSLATGDLSGSLTLGTIFRVGAGLASAPLAGGAGSHLFNFDLGFFPEGGLNEAQG